MMHPRRWFDDFQRWRHERKILETLVVARTGDSTGAYRWLWDGIESVLNNRFMPAERVWIDRIEALREEMMSSGEVLLVEDFGAALPPLEGVTGGIGERATVARTLSELAVKVSKSSFWGMILHKIIRGTRAMSCLELGTCVGVSAAYQATALELQHVGSLVTLEGAVAFAARAEANLKALDLCNVKIVVGRFEDTLDSVLAECAPLDYVFVDGHHEENATLGYFEQILPRMKKDAVLVFDDIDWSEGMKRAWRKIENDSRIALAVDLGQMGVIAIGEKTAGKKLVNLEMPW